jgi:NAD(P)H-dependent nitrite reductase small subunit
MAWTPLCPADALEIGAGRCFPLAGRKIVLFRTAEGFRALDDHCPHRSGPLSEGAVEDGAVSCPWHAWAFDLKTGECRTIPGQRVATYPVRVTDGTVEADLG